MTTSPRWAEVVVSDDQQSFVSRTSTTAVFDQVQRNRLADYPIELRALALSSGAAEPSAGKVEAVEQRLADQKGASDAVPSQVGDTHAVGAAGPSAFDCSGRTMMAWDAAGVRPAASLGGAMSYGPPVSSSALQPDDLISHDSPVSHVGLYLGNGQAVPAATTGTGAAIAPVFSMPFSGAVRPG